MSTGAPRSHLSRFCKPSHESLLKWPWCLCNRSVPQLYNTLRTFNCFFASLHPPLDLCLDDFEHFEHLKSCQIFRSNLFPEMFLYFKICDFSQNTPLERRPGLAICYPGSLRGLRFNTYCTCHDHCWHFPPTRQERIQRSSVGCAKPALSLGSHPGLVLGNTKAISAALQELTAPFNVSSWYASVHNPVSPQLLWRK